MVADDTPAVQAVLKADTRRLKLLDEEKKLQALLEKGEDSVSERLEKVRGCLFSVVLFSVGLFSIPFHVFCVELLTVFDVTKRLRVFLGIPLILNVSS